MTRIGGLLVAAMALLASGCATHGSVQTAHTIGQGKFQGAIEPGVAVAAGGGGAAAVPTFNLAGRYGVTDRFDLGFRFGTVAYELNAKIALTEPDPTATVVSLAPSATWFGIAVGGASTGFASVRLPLLVGLPVADDDQLVVGPKLSTYILTASGGGASAGGAILQAGGQIAYSAKFNNFRLHPELSFDIPVLGAASANSGTGNSASGVSVSASGVLVGFNLGLLFGGR